MKSKFKYVTPTIEIEKIPVEEGFCLSCVNNEAMRYLQNGDSDEWDW